MKFHPLLKKYIYKKYTPTLLFLIFLSGFSSAQFVPAITSFSPDSGPVGTSITLTGTNFKNVAGNSANNIIVTIKFSSPPSFAASSYPNLKYEKNSMINFEWDDASIGSMSALAIMSAKSFTDGAGNNKPYTLAVAVNGRAQYDNRIVGEHPVLGVVYNDMRQIINSGGDIENHAQYHDLELSSANFPLDKTIGAAANLKLLDDQLYAALGYKMNAMVVPTNYPGYMEAARNMGYAVGSSTGTFDGITNYPQWTPTGSLNIIPAGDNYLALGRAFTDTWDTALPEFKSFVDNILNGTSPTANRFFRIGSHNLNAQGAFIDLINYISAQANDRIWLTTMREFAEYRSTKHRTIKTEVLQGNTLTITLDQSAISDRVRWRDLSLKINSDATIESVTVNGATASYNTATKLINVFKQKLSFGAEETQEVPVERLEIGGAVANIISNTGSQIVATVMPGTVTGTVKISTAGGSATANGNFTVTAAASSISTLASLGLNSGNLSPAFSSAVLSYTASVANNVSSIKLIPTSTNGAAVIKVNGVAVASGSESAAIPLAVGTNTINTVITSQDNSAISTYALVVSRAPSLTAALSFISLSSGSLSPVFFSGTTAYSASVPHDVTFVTLTPFTVAATSVVRVNGVPISTGSASAAIQLAVGNNTITTMVTAQDNITTGTYTIVVNRAPSTTASLSSLSLSSGILSPAYATQTTAYTASVPHDVAAIKLTPSTAVITSVIRVNGVQVNSGNSSDAIQLAVGNNTITTVVTAQDNTTTRTYTIIVTRAPSSVATLSSLALSSGTLSPAFAPETIAYTASVPYNVESLTLTPISTATASAVRVNGVLISPGGATAGIPLVVGNNTIIIVATAADNITTRTYTVIVTRAALSEAALSSLSLSSGTFLPAFAPSTTAYTAIVPHGVASIKLTPLSTSNTSVVHVNGVMVSSGSPSAEIRLAVGNNTITIVVTAQDKSTTRTYTMIVSRAPSTAAALASLSLSSGILSPAFASGTTSYTAFVQNAISSIKLSPVSAENTMIIKVNGESIATGGTTSEIPLKVGDNIIGTIVTAQDNITTTTYTVVVTRAPSAPSAPSASAGLSSLSLSSGTLSPVFDPGTTSYTASVPHTVSSLKFSPVSSAYSRSIKVNGEAIVSGGTSSANPLIVGDNTFTTIVTAQDNITTKIYNVVVTRAPSTAAALSNLSLDSGTLSPVFAIETTSYTASVPHAVSSVTLSPVSAATTMSIKVNGVLIASGGTSALIPLMVGNNTVITVVTAQDNIANKAYSLVITRTPAATPLITHFTPLVAKNAATVTITGTNFAGITAVSFGGVPAKSFTVESPTKILAVVGNGASGDVSVTTPSGTAVLSGFTCLYTLPINNFRISSTGETCINSNNGSISIAAAEILNYIATITGDNIIKTQAFRNTSEFSGFAAGTYSVCITIDGRSDYKQCYEVVVNRPKKLELYVAVNNFADKSSITLQMKGSTSYKVELNGVRYTTSQDQITLPVTEGNNILRVTTDNECQGLIEKKIIINSSIKLYPNPVENSLNIDLGNNITNGAKVEIRNTAGRIVFSDRQNNTEGKLMLNLQNLEPAIYYLKLSLDNSESIFKILKK